MLRKALIVITITLTMGCSTKWQAETISITQASPVSIEKLKSRQAATAGDFMFTSWALTTFPIIQVHAPIKFNVDGARMMMKTVDTKTYSFEVEVPSGEAVLRWEDANGTKYYKHEEAIKVRKGEDQEGGTGGFAVLKDSPNKAYAFWVPHFLKGKAFLSDEHSPFKKLVGKSITNEFIGFGQTITYLGMVDGQLKFVYKEFDDKYIRQAFTQEFSFEYKPEFEYAFKTARFVVHEADATSVVFTVTKPFESL